MEVSFCQTLSFNAGTFEYDTVAQDNGNATIIKFPIDEKIILMLLICFRVQIFCKKNKLKNYAAIVFSLIFTVDESTSFFLPFASKK